MSSQFTFRQFLESCERRGEAINVLFEQRVFELIGILNKIAEPLDEAKVPYQLVGGLAVFLYVEQANAEHSVLTRDIDIMIWRADLERVVELAARSGFRFRPTAGVDRLLYGDSISAKNAIHLLFSGEKVKATQATPNPAINAVQVLVHGAAVSVTPVFDLLTMKLSSYRDKDRVHVRSMDAAGLITRELEARLPQELRVRLDLTRASE